MGVRVTLTQILVYVAAAILYAIAGIALAGLLRNPGVNIGSPYLLGPIAAVVIGGASLAGGLASPLSTFAAAFFLTGLNQMMRSLGSGDLAPVHRVRARDHRGNADLGRSDHQRRRDGIARTAKAG